MKTNEKKNTSAKKKLIPAVAMLTTSAVMLSTATYAWFTLSKTAEVTGLNLAATAGGSLEISLGQVDNGVLSSSDLTPTADNISWVSTVDIGQYYEKVGKLKPASTVDGNSLFYAEDSGIYAGGRAVMADTKVKAATDEATLTARTTTANTALATDEASGADGYYVDVPIWIRSTKQTKQDVQCRVTIKNKDSENNTENDLQKAVRVAVLPLKTATEANDSTTVTNTLSVTKASAVAGYADTKYTLLGDKASVFGLNWDNYTDNKGIKTTEGANYGAKLDTITFTKGTAQKAVPTSRDSLDNLTTVFELAGAGNNEYSVEGFVVRVWIEGESKFCNDATANQDWTIQLDFQAKDNAGN